MPSLSQLRRADASSGLVLLVVCAAVVLASLDLFIVNVALPEMAADLGNPDLADLSWVLNGYAIVYAALLLLFGRMAERRRRDLGFLVGVLVFTLASAACAAATSLEALIAARVLQAAGAALLTPTSLSLILATTEPAKRPTAVRIWTAVGGAAAALGPVLGGLLVAASWRWVFLVNVPIGLAALVLGWRRLPRVPGHEVPHPDALGAALGTGGIAALTLGLVKGEDWGWSSTSTVAALILAVLALLAFVVHTARAENPLVDPKLFHAPAFRGAGIAMILFSMAFGAMLLAAVLWAQGEWGWSALKTGLAIAPGPLMVPIFGVLLAGRLIARFGAGVVAGVGTAVFGLGHVWFAVNMTAEPSYAADMLPGMLLTGIGVGLTLPTLMATAAGSLPPHAFATGSAVVNTLRQVGLAIGVAILIALLGSTPDVDAFHHAWWVLAGLSFAASVAAFTLLTRPLAAQDQTKVASREAQSVPT